MTDFCLCIVLFVYICLPIIYIVQAEMCRSMELILPNRTKKWREPDSASAIEAAPNT